LLNGEQIEKNPENYDDVYSELEESFYYQGQDAIDDQVFDVIRRIVSKVTLPKQLKEEILEKNISEFDDKKDEINDWKEVYIEASPEEIKGIKKEDMEDHGLDTEPKKLYKKKLKKMSKAEKLLIDQEKEQATKNLIKDKSIDIIKSERLGPTDDWEEGKRLLKKHERYIPIERKACLNVI
jgi:hypothetical protein